MLRFYNYNQIMQVQLKEHNMGSLKYRIKKTRVVKKVGRQQVYYRATTKILKVESCYSITAFRNLQGSVCENYPGINKQRTSKSCYLVKPLPPKHYGNDPRSNLFSSLFNDIMPHGFIFSASIRIGWPEVMTL